MESDWEPRSADPAVPEAELRARIRTYAGPRPIRQLARCGGGLVNENVIVDLGEPDERVVLRLYRRDEAETVAAKEHRLLQAVAGVVPAPTPLELSLVDGVPQAIHGFVPGALLKTCFASDDEDAHARAGETIGAALARLHAHRQPVMGFLDGDLRVPDPMGPLPGVWRGYVLDALTTGRAATRLGPETSDALAAFADAHADRLASIDGAFTITHGDCKPTNVLVDQQGALTGFLDWEFAFSGPALFDLGQMFRWPVPPAFDAALVTAYERNGARLPEGWRALARMLDLLNLVGFLDMAGERPTVVRDCRRLLRASLAALA